MKNPGFLLILFVTIVVLAALSHVDVKSQQGHVPRAETSGSHIGLNRDILNKDKMPQIYGKIKLPAELSIKLLPSGDSKTPVTLLMSASSMVPVSSGKIILKIPQIGVELGGSVELWSGTPSDFVSESLQYVIETLPVGIYQFILVFEFVPLDEVETLAFSKSLYLDVRPTTILSSNVSFRQIKRLELMKELEKRAFLSLRPELTNGDAQMASIESIDPGIILRKIQEIKASDPDIARRIMELNRVEADTSEDFASAETDPILQPDMENEPAKTLYLPLRIQTVYDEPVPIPERFRGE